MKDIFTRNESPYNLRNNSRHENDLEMKSFKAFTYGECSLKVLGPMIWNSLPTDLKNANSLHSFKKLISVWDGPRCLCKMCKAINPH